MNSSIRKITKALEVRELFQKIKSWWVDQYFITSVLKNLLIQRVAIIIAGIWCYTVQKSRSFEILLVYTNCLTISSVVCKFNALIRK